MNGQRAVDHLSGVPRVVSQTELDAARLSGSHNWIVHGRVTGNSEVRGAVFLAEDAEWVGNLSADLVIIKGRLSGRLAARQKLEVRKTASIDGDISSPMVAIAHGAHLGGRIDPAACVIRFNERRG